MGLVLGLALALWAIGALMKVPPPGRWAMIAALYAAVLAVQLALPAPHPLKRAIGGSPEGWLALGGAVAAVLGYRAGLRALRRRAARHASRQAPVASGPFRATELDRYARHIVLREIGGPGQKRLKQAKVLVIGAGGLGSPALMYLGAAGVGTLGVVDDDIVSNSNLQRQVIHTDARIGLPKVFSAKEAILGQNPFVEVRPYNRRLDETTARLLFAEYDLILDGSDNFETRYLVNRVAVETGTPLVAAAIAQWEGQISLYDPARGTPCYACIFPEAPAPGLAPSCAEAGVVGPLPGVMGTMMAVEAIKALTGAGEGLRGRMLIYDALYADTRVIALKRRPGCPVCGRG
ncbi:HesA/MoeB/ThiF family protein [Rhodovulum euryhalinum]|uniref:Molybdopterin-synthase adenylyltransferase n=1 Tax=Rhodovulum euryhalinum TaxID=35805 RepID=A0A4R2L408_9RHOB|nr:HesA/MoeB/ThiF family protein [Rhodovulum euryhalinum]TCO73865.1 molybdopterin/thiamine biosynthesis adenylyltransferase [Rhodovulum euryhalinum]